MANIIGMPDSGYRCVERVFQYCAGVTALHPAVSRGGCRASRRGAAQHHLALCPSASDRSRIRNALQGDGYLAGACKVVPSTLATPYLNGGCEGDSPRLRSRFHNLRTAAIEAAVGAQQLLRVGVSDGPRS